ncbi:unnamed protein product [Citrullus colocynthis]|uniref:Uncharacterized protein n=1 Tax=Citrullus colocynthis TaxID=252529 RepID=A0ABP0Z6W5_9ROSI
MGGNRAKKSHSSSFSFLGALFKSKRGRRGDHYYEQQQQQQQQGSSWDDFSCPTKVWPSDADKCHRWVAEPGIDRKAKDYIDRIHRNRVFETQRQTVTLPPDSNC